MGKVKQTNPFAISNLYLFLHLSITAMLRLNLILFFFTISFDLLLSQDGFEINYTIKSYTVDQALPNNHVRGIAQDQNGFIWIVTWDAVSRYDGYEFRNYYNDPDDSTSAPGMDNHNLVIDKNNIVWVNNSLGLYRYDRMLDNFYPVIEFKLKNVHSTSIGSDKNLWVLSDLGLQMNMDTSQFLTIKPCSPVENKFYENFASFCIDNDYLWSLQKDTIRCFDVIKNEENKNYCYKENRNYFINWQPSLTNFQYNFQVYLMGNTKLIAGNLGLFKVDSLRHECIQIKNINELQGLPQEIMVWNSPDGQFNLLNKNNFNFSFKPGNNGTVQTWLVDKNNDIWLGILKSNSEGAGLTKVTFQTHQFNHFLTENETGERLGIISILKDSFGDVWVGTIGNYFLYHLNVGKKPEKCVFINKNFMPSTIHSRSLLNSNGKIFAGNTMDLLYCFNPFNKRPEFLYPGKIKSILPENFKSFKILMKDKSGNLIIAGTTGICLVNLLSEKLLFHENTEKGNDLYAILNDCDTNYWFGSNGYLIRYDKHFNNRTFHTIADKKFNIESIIEGDSDHLWLALLGGGICRFNKKTGKTEIYSTQYGLKNNTCYNVLMDKHGHIWVSTNQGISMFNPDTKHFRNFGKAEGLEIVEFNADAVWHGDDDEMMFGGMGGFVSFYPDSIENGQSDYYAPLLITEISVSGRTIYPDVYSRKHIELGKGTDNFQIAFACLDYRNANELVYRFRLAENDTGWIKTDNRKRFSNYINLHPGTYHFKVQVTNAVGDWQKNKETDLTIVIPAFYYQTLLFKISLGILLTFLIAMSILMYIRHLRMKEQRKRELLIHEEEVKREQLKLEALRGQLNPHFIFNSLNSVNDFILDSDPIRANQYLTDFSGLMRAFLDNSKQEFIPLIKEIELLENYLKLEQIRFSDRFDFVIDYEEVDNLYVEIMPSMIQPFVENAVWHGIAKNKKDKKGIISIFFKQNSSGYILCEVSDNGIGIVKSKNMRSEEQKKRQSRGIGIIQQRLAITNTVRNTKFKIGFEEVNPSDENPGTKVKLEIPIRI